jgi:hypothetical protein
MRHSRVSPRHLNFAAAENIGSTLRKEQNRRADKIHKSEPKSQPELPAPTLDQRITGDALWAAFRANLVYREGDLRKSGVFGEEPRPEDIKPTEKDSQ